MNKTQVIAAWTMVLLILSGCAVIQEHSKHRHRSESKENWPPYTDYPPGVDVSELKYKKDTNSKGKSNISKPPEGLIVCPPEVHILADEMALRDRQKKEK